MKFKPIKPGTYIHCQTEEEAKALLRHLRLNGYCIDENDYCINQNSGLFKRAYVDAPDLVDVIRVGRRTIEYDTCRFYKLWGHKITEFSDVVEV